MPNRELVKDVIEKVESSLNQYENGLITGPEALFGIAATIAENEPALTVIYEYDKNLTETQHKLREEMQKALEEIEKEPTEDPGLHVHTHRDRDGKELGKYTIDPKTGIQTRVNPSEDR